MCTLLQRQDEIGREENRLRCLSHQTRNKDYSSSGPLPPPSFSVLPPYSVLNASIKRTTDRLSHKISKKKKKKKKKLFFSFPRPIGHVTLRRSTLRKKKNKKIPESRSILSRSLLPCPVSKTGRHGVVSSSGTWHPYLLAMWCGVDWLSPDT